MARKTAVTVDVANEAEADRVLQELAALKRKVSRLEAELNARVDALKEEAEGQVAPLAEGIKAREEALARWAKHSTEVFQGRRTLQLTFGALGFRAATALRTATKTTWDQVLSRLLAMGGAAVRVKETVDKEALGKWSDEALEELGVRRSTRHQFWYELDEQRLGDGR